MTLKELMESVELGGEIRVYTYGRIDTIARSRDEIMRLKYDNDPIMSREVVNISSAPNYKGFTKYGTEFMYAYANSFVDIYVRDEKSKANG